MNCRGFLLTNAASLVIASTVCVAAGSTALAANLIGSYGVTGTGICLVAPGGFNDKNQPNDVDNSFLNTVTYKGVIKYDGHGQFNATLTTVNIATPISPKSPPSSGSSEVHFQGTYQIKPDGSIKSIPGKGTGKNLIGPRAGQSFEVNGTEFAGWISTDGNTLISGSEPKVTTVNLANGKTISRICSETDIEVKLSSE